MSSGGRAGSLPGGAAVWESFEDCYSACLGDALRFASTLTRDRHQAEDAVANAFVKVYRRWGVTDISRPRAYIRRAVANELVSAFRRRGRERACYGRAWTAEPSPDAGDGICERDALGVLLAGVPPRQRTAVVLRYLHDLSEAEVARRMGTSVGAVKSNTARGLDALRAAVARSGGGHPWAPAAQAQTRCAVPTPAASAARHRAAGAT